MEFLSVALAVVVAALSSAFSQGIATRAAMEGIARQPEASGDIRTTLIPVSYTHLVWSRPGKRREIEER